MEGVWLRGLDDFTVWWPPLGPTWEVGRKGRGYPQRGTPSPFSALQYRNSRIPSSLRMKYRRVLRAFFSSWRTRSLVTPR